MKLTLYSKTSSPTDEELEKFIRVLITRLQAQKDDTNVPSLGTIRNVVRILMKYLAFKYNWQPSIQFEARLESLFNQKVNQGELSTMSMKPREFISIHLLNRILRAYITSSLEDGCRNFDAILLASLPLALMSAVDCRVGNITGCQNGPDTYMRLEDVQLYLQGGNDIKNLRANVVLKNEKGKIHKSNHREREVGTFNNPGFNCVDFILLLFVHALRLNLFLHGPNPQDVLSKAADHHLGLLARRNPTLPVFCQQLKRTRQLNVEAPMLKSTAI